MADQNDQPPPIADVEAEGDAEGDDAVAQVAALGHETFTMYRWTAEYAKPCRERLRGA